MPSSVKLAGIGQEYSEVVTWNPPPSHLPAQAAAFEETPKTIQDSEPNYMVQTQTVLKAKTQWEGTAVKRLDVSQHFLVARLIFASNIVLAILVSPSAQTVVFRPQALNSERTLTEVHGSYPLRVHSSVPRETPTSHLYFLQIGEFHKTHSLSAPVRLIVRGHRLCQTCEKGSEELPRKWRCEIHTLLSRLCLSRDELVQLVCSVHPWDGL